MVFVQLLHELFILFLKSAFLCYNFKFILLYLSQERLESIKISELLICKKHWLWACVLGDAIFPFLHSTPFRTKGQSWLKPSVTKFIKIFLLYLSPAKSSAHSVCHQSWEPMFPQADRYKHHGKMGLNIGFGMMLLFRKKQSKAFGLGFYSCIRF